jgi:hypothetical protein
LLLRWGAQPLQPPPTPPHPLQDLSPAPHRPPPAPFPAPQRTRQAASGSELSEPEAKGASSLVLLEAGSAVEGPLRSLPSPLLPHADPSPLVKFPRTRHLLNPGGSAVGEDDELCDAAATRAFLGAGQRLLVQEKVDGANLGISLEP